jgi:hypothetical protein
MAAAEFTCEHCGKQVPPGRWKRGSLPRNHCPYCLWSKHVEIGEEVGYPPCGAMMRGTDVGGEQVVWRCLGCGFMMRGPTDDYVHRAVKGGLGSTADFTFYPRELGAGRRPKLGQQGR